MKSRQAKKILKQLGRKTVRLHTATNALATTWQRSRFKKGDRVGQRMMTVSSRGRMLFFARLFDKMAKKELTITPSGVKL